jgi:hypothetical protein
MENDNKNKSNTWQQPKEVARKSKAFCLLEKHLTRVNRVKQIKKLIVVGNRDGSNQRGAPR